MSRLFKRLFLGAFVAIKSTFALRKLLTKKYEIPTQELVDGKLDTNEFGLPPGTYTITLTACSQGLRESNHSNHVVIRVTNNNNTKYERTN